MKRILQFINHRTKTIHELIIHPIMYKKNILQIAHENKIDLEGACESSLACSTCHVILDPKDYSGIIEPSEQEQDMLDLAYGVTSTSRLGCQLMVQDLFTNVLNHKVSIIIPSETRNIAVDGYIPKPH